MYLHLHASKTFNTDQTELLDKNKLKILLLNFSRRQETIRDERSITLINTQIKFFYMQQHRFWRLPLDKF